MPDEQPAWAFEHSIDCGVTAAFAWSFWTSVSNWTLDVDVESVEIDGPFAAGAQGFTNSRSSGRVPWRIVQADAGRAVIEIPAPGAVARITWTFEGAGGSARITQRWTLQGEQAESLAKAFAPGLETGIPAGMTNLCAAMERASRVP